MEDSEERRYICRICSKSCVSGKSLGGHMRIHLTEIAASKKAELAKAKIKMKIKDGDHDQKGSFRFQESFKNRSNTQKFKTRPLKMDLEDADQSNCYKLRENPKKSWKKSASKRCLVTSPEKKASCKECGKKFYSLRALSGHMRCHSIKTTQLHDCTKCGKGFDSSRAMFGHMKTHSTKRSKVVSEAPESLCPVRKKRSAIRYKASCNPSFSSSNVSDNAVSETWDIEEVAKWLIILSQGVRESKYQDPVIKSSDDDDDNSLYFDSGSSSSHESTESHGNFGDKKLKSSPIAKALAGNNISEADYRPGQIELEYKLKLETEEGVVGLLSSDTINNSKERESPNWLKASSSGQDSRGRKRARCAESETEEAIAVMKQEVFEVKNLFDLNFSLTVTGQHA